MGFVDLETVSITKLDMKALPDIKELDRVHAFLLLKELAKTLHR